MDLDADPPSGEHPLADESAEGLAAAPREGDPEASAGPLRRQKRPRRLVVLGGEGAELRVLEAALRGRAWEVVARPHSEAPSVLTSLEPDVWALHRPKGAALRLSPQQLRAAHSAPVLSLRCATSGPLAEDFDGELQLDGDPVELLVELEVALARFASAAEARGARLRQPEELLLAAEQLAMLGSWEWDVDTDTARVSAGMSALTGLPGGSAISNLSELFSENIHPDDRDRVRATIERCVTQGIPAHTVFRYRAPGGEERILESRGALGPDELGRPRMMRGITQDVTERVLLEECLAEHALRLESVFHATRDGIWDWTLSTDTAFYSRRWAELLETSPEELPPAIETFLERLHADDRELFWGSLCEHLAGATAAQQCEVRLRLQGGSYRWFLNRARVLTRDAQGAPRRVVGSISDIHESRRVRAALQESEDRYRGIFEDVALGICRTDAEGRILAANPELLRMLRCDSAERLRGRELRSLFLNPSEAAQLNFASDDARYPPEVHALWRTFAGGVLPVEVRGSFTHSEDGSLRFYQALVRDLTEEHEREARERSLLEHTEQLELIIEGTRLGFWDWNPQTQVVHYSERWAEMLGYRVEDLRPHLDACLSLVHPADRPLCAESMRAHLAGELPFFEAVHRMRHRDGSWRYILSRGKVFARDAEGRPTRYCGTHVDITAEKQAEREAIEANRAKTHFLANMSHELRTPLNAVLGLSEALLEGTAGPLTPKQRDSLLTVHDSGQHLLELINDVLDIARIEAGRLALEVRETPFSPLLGQCLSYVLDAAERKSQRLTREVDPELPWLHVDPRRLKQVLVNLLTNAIRYSPEEAEVFVGARRLSEFPAVELWVEDTGPGIPASERERVFAPFVQLDESLTRNAGGVGLGLALVRRIVSLHGGSVRVEDGRTGGARFVVTLPTTPLGEWPLETAERRPRASEPPLPPLLLLAEDDNAQVRTLFPHLEAQGYRVNIVRDGHTAVHAAAMPQVALVLLGEGLHELDSLEALRRLRAAEKGPRKPVVVLTSASAPEVLDSFLSAGATTCLRRPLCLRRLLDTIHALLAPSTGATS